MLYSIKNFHLVLFFKKIYLFYLYVQVFACIVQVYCVYCVHTWCTWRPGTLKLELWMLVSCHVSVARTFTCWATFSEISCCSYFAIKIYKISYNNVFVYTYVCLYMQNTCESYKCTGIYTYILTIYMCMNIYTYMCTCMCKLICNASVRKNGFKSKKRRETVFIAFRNLVSIQSSGFHFDILYIYVILACVCVCVTTFCFFRV